MAISEYQAGSGTYSATPLWLQSSSDGSVSTLSTDTGIYQLFLTAAAVAQSLLYHLYLHEDAGGTGSVSRLLCSFEHYAKTSSNPNGEGLFVFPPMILVNAWGIEVVKESGVSVTFEWSIRRVS